MTTKFHIHLSITTPAIAQGARATLLHKQVSMTRVCHIHLSITTLSIAQGARATLLHKQVSEYDQGMPHSPIYYNPIYCTRC